ncbi:unnamed protein product [Arabis nemorensis]|uniref:Uncharacterized protein n=1 Tax=Arabis nemorensis TaxID=586526 RepID=A0A565BTG8_9BRAS|nr:unnamed protein product [Arabis nemorensis]
MTLDYEVESKANRRQLEDAQRDAEKYNGDASVATKPFADLESEIKLFRDQLDRVRKDNEDLTASNTRRFHRLEDCFAKLRAFGKEDANVQHAVHKARCEMTTKFQETLTCIERQFDVVEQARERSFDLAQAEGNLQLVQQVRSETPSDLETEEEDLIAAVAESEKAHQMLTDEVTNLRRILRALPVGLDDGERIDLAAASLGVRNFSGSNSENPGLSGLSAKRAASGPTTTESLAPAHGALAFALVEPTIVSVERITATVIPAPISAPEGGESVPSASVDAEVSEQVPVETATDEAAEQVLVEVTTNEAAVLDGMEVVATA